MENLYVLVENYTNGFNINYTYIIFILAILTNIFVIITKNPVLSVLFLIGLFLIMSVYLMLLGANFIGLSYILVYVGAVSILFLFILMLINIRISELISNTSNSLLLAILVPCIFFIFISEIVIYIDVFKEILIYPSLLVAINKFISYISIKTASAVYWDGNLIEISHISSIGNIIYTNYFLWLILSSVILLLAMIGAIVITIVHTKTTNNIYKY